MCMGSIRTKYKDNRRMHVGLMDRWLLGKWMVGGDEGLEGEVSKRMNDAKENVGVSR